MLALFKSAPLVDEQEQQWLIDTFLWAVEHFDSEYFLKHTQIILPNGQFFPDRVSSVSEMAEKVFNLCKKYDIKLLVDWVPRELNQYADYLSKMVDHDDWQTSGLLFNYLEQQWGPDTIDRFTNSSNTKLRRFNSKFLTQSM